MGGFDERSLEQSKYLSGAIENVCSIFGAEFMNAADYAEASKIDDIHMDEENHAKLAEVVFEKIKSIKK